MRGYLGCCHAGLTVVDNILAAHRTGLTSKPFDVGIQAAAVKGTTGRSKLKGTKWNKAAHLCVRRLDVLIASVF